SRSRVGSRPVAEASFSSSGLRRSAPPAASRSGSTPKAPARGGGSPFGAGGAPPPPGGEPQRLDPEGARQRRGLALGVEVDGRVADHVEPPRERLHQRRLAVAEPA